MLYREIMAVCSQIHTKHINTLCGQNLELLNIKLAVHIVTKRHKIQHTMYSVRKVRSVGYRYSPSLHTVSCYLTSDTQAR